MTTITPAMLRTLLEYAIRERDVEAARTAIAVGMADDSDLHTMTDLHFPLMLLLAAPEPETRGRPRDPETESYTWYLNMACKIRADKDGASFTKTWAAYCERTRPKAVDYDLWRCAGILELLARREWKHAIAAINKFELTAEDLEAYKAVKK